jgi:carbonic anhydrase/acetyltransferase-like protein (isoleucine patch superfamily)
MPLLPYKGKLPVVGRNCYIAPTAMLIGDVTIEDGASIWFGAVLRGDVAPIHIGRNSNIQDGAVLHGEYDCPTIIGENVTVGHNAVVHAAIVADRVLVGMGSVLLSRCRIGSDTIIGARALVTEEMEIPSGCLAVGMPSRVRRNLTEHEREHIMLSAQHYIDYAAQYLSECDRTPGD